MVIGLLLLLAAIVVIFLYMFIHSLHLSKNRLIIAFAVIGFAAGYYYIHIIFSTVAHSVMNKEYF